MVVLARGVLGVVSVEDPVGEEQLLIMYMCIRTGQSLHSLVGFGQ